MTGGPKSTSPEALDILREEAAFEAEQRAREAGVLETQPELGLLGAAPWPSTPKDAPIPDAAPSKTARATETHSDAFLDIEDISASLDPIGSERNQSKASGEKLSVPPTSAERNQSFIRGLMLPVIVALILIALYLLAPIIGNAVPVLSPVTSGYLGAVDGLRNAIFSLLGL